METQKQRIKCRECGKRETLIWCDEMNDELKRQRLCFTCNFWREKIEWRATDDPRACVVDGIHYRAADESASPSQFRGFGGRRFKILFTDGRLLETSNLWCQGRVPERFRGVLTDNAKIL